MDLEGAFFDTNEYELTPKNLGEGKFGKVFVVEKDETQYAAKIIINNGEFDGYNQMLLIRETSILHKIKHPAIIKFYGINFHSFDDPFKLEPTIITEYLKNGSLKEILKKEQNSIADANWSPTKKYICLLGIADALRYLHMHGIIHRDLKPENVLIDDNYYPHVCDFGLARCFNDELNKSAKLVMTGKIGTPLYMAPELMSGDDEYGPAIDVYAFAVLAYEIVTQTLPFSEKGKSIGFVQLTRNVISGVRPKFTEGVTEKMKELITQCWNQNSEERPSFDEIYNKLSSDLTYFDEDIDEDEINEYIETLKEETKNLLPVHTADDFIELENKIKKLEEKEDDHKKLSNDYEMLKKDNQTNISNVRKLENEVAQLKKQADLMKKENEMAKQKLINENERLKKENETIKNKLTAENERLRKENEIAKQKLISENERLRKENETINNNLKKMTDEINELKKQNDEKNADTITKNNIENKANKPSVIKEDVIIENNPVIIDNGTYDIKAGFSGEKSPRYIFRNIAGLTKTYNSSFPPNVFVGEDAYMKSAFLNVKYPMERSAITNWDYMEKIWDYTFKNQFHIDPSEYSIILPEPAYINLPDREKIAQIMFEKFNTHSILCLCQTYFSLLSYGRTEGIVLEIGEGITTVLPYFTSNTIPDSIKTENLSGYDLNEYLIRLVSEVGLYPSRFLEKQSVIKAKEEICYVAFDYDKELRNAEYSASDYNESFDVVGGQQYTINTQRFRCPEILFNPNLNGLNANGVHKMVFDSINLFQKEQQNFFYDNIVLAGGTTMLNGFPERFEKEITSLAPPKTKINICSMPDRKFASFIGASIYGGLNIYPQIVFTHKSYNENGASFINKLGLNIG